VDGLLVGGIEEWIDAEEQPPQIGDIVRVLSWGGVDCGKAQWRADSHLHFCGYLPLTKIPPALKRKIVERTMYSRHPCINFADKSWMAT
jgi:hypothetical protein